MKTLEQKRIAVAEFCKWTNIKFYEDNAGPSFWYGIPPLTIEQTFQLSASKVEDLRKYGTRLPDYPSDLNALREAVLMLPEELRLVYSQHCGSLCHSFALYNLCVMPWDYESLTCEQRFDCLCKTIGAV